MSLPSRILQRVPPGVALTTRRLVGALRGRGGTGGEQGSNKRVTAGTTKRQGRIKSPLSARRRAAEPSLVPLEGIRQAGGIYGRSTNKDGGQVADGTSASRSPGARTTTSSGENISPVLLEGSGVIRSSGKAVVSPGEGVSTSSRIQSSRGALTGGAVVESRRAFVLRPTEELEMRKLKAGMGRGSSRR